MDMIVTWLLELKFIDKPYFLQIKYNAMDEQVFCDKKKNRIIKMVLSNKYLII
jgi:hypothetical protein